MFHFSLLLPNIVIALKYDSKSKGKLRAIAVNSDKELQIIKKEQSRKEAKILN